jgi:hypothetical protein
LEDDEAADRYAAALARAGAPADPADCAHLEEADRARYCEIVSEGSALEDAYSAWRLARRVGVVALEGHPPVDLEVIR